MGRRDCTSGLPGAADRTAGRVVADAPFARQAWRGLEGVNAVTYFSEECRAAQAALGLRGFWMGYFGGRAAPMGPVGAGVVEATFFNFHPEMVRRAIPDAWNFAAPDAIVASRSEAAAAAIRRLVPHADEIGAIVWPLLRRVIDAASAAGRPLFAANRDVAIGDGVPGVWQAATTLREHRGDGHVATLTEAGIDGCEAHVLYAATEGVPPDLLRLNRGWTEADWDEAVERLRDRGLVGSAGQATGAGRDLRERIERRTDELALSPYHALGDASGLIELLQRLAMPIVSSGEIRFPNPMGLPGPNE